MSFSFVAVCGKHPVASKGCGLKIFHVNVRERAAGGFAPAEPFDLLEKAFAPSEEGEVEVEFDQRQDVVIMPQQQQSNFHSNKTCIYEYINNK